MINPKILSRWKSRSRRGSLNKLHSLLEFRAMIPDFKAEAVLMNAYAEASKAMVCSAETLRRDIGIIREYAKEDLLYWITNDVSFDHIEKSNELAELAKKTPLQLLNECIDPGNAAGETMTVRELQAFALGEQIMRPVDYKINVVFTRLGDLYTGLNWPDEKIVLYQNWVREGREFFQ